MLSVALAVPPMTAPLASALLVLCCLAKTPRQAVLSAVMASALLAGMAVASGAPVWSAPATLAGWLLIIGMAALVRR